MKKFVAVISILLLLFCHFWAVGEEIDLSALSDIELSELLTRALEEISNRENFTADMYWPGTYVCGEDFVAGTYLIENVARPNPSLENQYGFVYIWENEEEYNRHDVDKMYKINLTVGGTQKYDIKNENIIEIDSAICSFILVN